MKKLALACVAVATVVMIGSGFALAKPKASEPVKVQVMGLVKTESASDPGCKRGEDLLSSDLCAQWKAADAARDAADSARRSETLAWWILGTSFLFNVATLGALIVGYRDNRKAQRLEHRAYVEVKVVAAVASSSDTLIFSGTMRNYGRTPCKITLSAKGDVRGGSAASVSMAAFHGALKIETLHPGDALPFSIPCAGLFIESVSTFIVEEVAVADIDLIIVNDDVFGDAHVSTIKRAAIAIVRGSDFHEVY